MTFVATKPITSLSIVELEVSVVAAVDTAFVRAEAELSVPSGMTMRDATFTDASLKMRNAPFADAALNVKVRMHWGSSQANCVSNALSMANLSIEDSAASMVQLNSNTFAWTSTRYSPSNNGANGCNGANGGNCGDGGETGAGTGAGLDVSLVPCV